MSKYEFLEIQQTGTINVDYNIRKTCCKSLNKFKILLKTALQEAANEYVTSKYNDKVDVISTTMQSHTFNANSLRNYDIDNYVTENEHYYIVRLFVPDIVISTTVYKVDMYAMYQYKDNKEICVQQYIEPFTSVMQTFVFELYIQHYLDEIGLKVTSTNSLSVFEDDKTLRNRLYDYIIQHYDV